MPAPAALNYKNPDAGPTAEDKSLHALGLMKRLYQSPDRQTQTEKPSFEDAKEALLQMFDYYNYTEDQLAKLWEQA